MPLLDNFFSSVRPFVGLLVCHTGAGPAFLFAQVNLRAANESSGNNSFNLGLSPSPNDLPLL